MKSIAARLTFACIVLTGSGCTTAKYRPAPKQTPPAGLINLTATQPPIEAVVHSVIIYRGPGSWKREAYWDEYVVSVVNRGTIPWRFEEATLEDFQGATNIPGQDPWQLEDQSKTWWQKAKSSQTGSLVAIGTGSVLMAASLAGASLSITGFLGPATATSTALAGASVAVLVAAPVYAVGVVIVNSNNKEGIEAEFRRRRLVLPATIAPGETGQGSLFFRLSPGPQRLVLRGRAGGPPAEITFDLAPLSGLHLKAGTVSNSLSSAASKTKR